MRARQTISGLAVAALTLLAAALPARAGFIHGSIDLGFTPPGPPPWVGGIPPFVVEITPGNSALAKMDILEDLTGLDPLNLRVTGQTDADPIIEITKNVTNNSSFTWTGYEIGVSGGSNTFVAGSASSNTMTLITETANLLTFGLPNAVPDGGSVSFTFQVLIPTTGGFQFDLSQEAVIPEPATAASLLLLALGAATARRR